VNDPASPSVNARLTILAGLRSTGVISHLPSVPEFGVYRRSKPKHDFDFTSALILTLRRHATRSSPLPSLTV
jgi:hypothetical protein